MSVEIHASSRGILNPDPEFDPIQSVFYSISHDAPPESLSSSKLNGIIYINNRIDLKGAYLDEVEVVPVENEVELFEKLVQLIYMVEKNSNISVVGRIVLNLWRLLRSEVLLF